MTERIEFRIFQNLARHVLPDEMGVVIGDGVARKVVVESTDPSFALIKDAHASARAQGKMFVSGWRISRTYSAQELEEATLFNLRLEERSFLNDAGESHGTTYDESTACAICGAGGRQTSPLRLDLKSISLSRDIRTSIAGETILSSKAVDVLTAAGIKGMKLDVVSSQNGKERSESWKQLFVPYVGASIVSPTLTGNGPFDLDLNSAYRCPIGPLLGLNLLSELTVKARELKPDISTTAEYLGTRRGLLRPYRPTIVSAAFRRAFLDGRLKGANFDVVHVNS